MIEIKNSAAYVWNTNTLQAHGNRVESLLQSLQEKLAFPMTDGAIRVWQLLETPQTLTSICRALSDVPQGAEEQCMQAIKSYLAQLFERDLIQLSPDT